MKVKYFNRIVDNLEFNFIPIFSIKDNSILGYKIIKDFSHLGFNDKEYMYQLAYEEGIFEEFSLQMLKKAYEEALTNNFSSKYLFYTLRLNFTKDIRKFFSSVDNIIHTLNLETKNIIFDIKGIENWEEFYQDYGKYFKYKIILKEDRYSAFNINNILKSQATFIEPRTIDTLAFIKLSSNVQIPFIFNLKNEKEPLLSQIKALEIDYYYNY